MLIALCDKKFQKQCCSTPSNTGVQRRHHGPSFSESFCASPLKSFRFVLRLQSVCSNLGITTKHNNVQENNRLFASTHFLLKIQKYFLGAFQQSYPHVLLVRIVSHAYSTNQSLVRRMGSPCWTN